MSGNGWHGLYRVDLPADSDLPRRLVHALAALFDDETATVDRSVHNAARICRLPGTRACKGDASEARPHRLCTLARVPSGGVKATETATVSECVDKLEREAAARSGGATVSAGGALAGGKFGAFDAVSCAERLGL